MTQDDRNKRVTEAELFNELLAMDFMTGCLEEEEVEINLEI